MVIIFAVQLLLKGVLVQCTVGETSTFKNVTCNVRGNITLKCPSDDQIRLPVWVFGEGNNGKHLTVGYKTNPNFSRTPSLEIENKNKKYFNLILNDVSKRDEGIYCCATFYITTTTAISPSTLLSAYPNPTEVCTYLFVSEARYIHINKNKEGIGCSITTDNVGALFSWNIHTTGSQHQICHNENDSLRLSNEKENGENRDIRYSCTASFYTVGALDNNAYEVSRFINGLHHPFCFAKYEESYARPGDTVRITFFGNNDTDFELLKDGIRIREGAFSYSIVNTKMRIEICNTTVFVNVSEYNFEIQYPTGDDFRSTYRLNVVHSNNSATCTHAILKKGNNKKFPTALMIYIAVCFVCTVIFSILNATLSCILTQMEKDSKKNHENIIIQI